jgi:Sulfotransferase family
MSIRGFFAVVDVQQIRGWAYDPEQPDRHLPVTALANGRVLGAALADNARADLAVAKVGSGDHGFELRLEVPLSRDELRNVEVVVGRDNGAARLQRARARGQAAALPMSGLDGFPWPRDVSQHPVFVLGTTRSGTTAISSGLLKTRQYAGAGEGHLLELLGELLATVDQYYEKRTMTMSPDAGTLLRKTSAELFFVKIAEIFTALISDMFPGRYWVDKTPSQGMIQISPILSQLWPNAKFIFMKRRGIENVESKKRKFNGPFVNRCNAWAGAMNEWLRVRDSLGSAAIEIDQIDLAIDPFNTAQVVMRHIDLPSKHLKEFVEILSLNRPELTTRQFPYVENFAEMTWTDEERRTFQRLCGPMIDAYGYTYDRRYRQIKPVNL